MDRRDFARGLGSGMILACAGGSSGGRNDGPTRAGTPASLPREVAGVRIVDSALARAATAVVVEVSEPYLVNHVMRTYLFGALVGRAAGVRVDEELLFLACAMHDLGLTDRFMGELPFEIQGAIAARRLLIEHGMSVERASIVWDAIAMHPLAIADHKPPEIRLVAAGAAADVVGAGLDGLAAFEVAAVVHAFPRLDMKRAFVKSCGDVVAKYPRGAARTFMRDIGEREVPGYHPSNICDAIQRAPFDS